MDSRLRGNDRATEGSAQQMAPVPDGRGLLIVCKTSSSGVRIVPSIDLRKSQIPSTELTRRLARCA